MILIFFIFHMLYLNVNSNLYFAQIVPVPKYTIVEAAHEKRNKDTDNSLCHGMHYH
jgi:hypothetical protein